MSGETEQNVSGWTVDTAHVHVLDEIKSTESRLNQRIDDMTRMLQERYETQVKAVDAAFAAQVLAMQTALTAAERAVATALLSAEKAVNKAESAADKRFESVNEFRAQLADQAATFLARTEAEARFNALVEKVDIATGNNSGRIRELEARLNVMQGHDTGSTDSGAVTSRDRTLLIATVGTFLALLSLVITLYVATR